MRAPPAARALALAALALAAPLAAAHIEHDRPHLQSSELLRTPAVTMDGARARFDLQLRADPFEDLVRHDVDPKSGSFRGEYRRQPSSTADSFAALWSLGRIIEYRDVNANGVFEPNADTVVKAWPFSGYSWNVTGPTDVGYVNRQGVTVAAKDVAWVGTIANGPTVKLEVDAAGDAFVDEGASVLPQDVIAYLDVGPFPARGVGDLFAFDGNVTIPGGATLARDLADANTTAGLVARVPQRLAGFDWGAQATLDGREQFVSVTTGEPGSGGAPEARSFRLHFPLFERSLHMVFVSGVEYVNPAKRGTDAVGPALVVVAVGLLALGRRRDE